MAAPDGVFDIRKLKISVDGKELAGIAPDGFGYTPMAEHTLIPGLKGEQGASLDPSTRCEATVTFKSTAEESILHMRDIYLKQTAGNIGGVVIEISTTEPKMYGFTKLTIQKAWIQKPFPFQTNEKESPNIAFNIVGYGYKEA